MQSIKKQLSKNKIKLTVTVPAEIMEGFFESEFERLAPTVTLPGFRPGKAPRAMIIESLGHTRLSQGALELGLNAGFRDALNEHKLNPVTQPAISISKHPSYLGDSNENELMFDVEFDILPEAKIGNWRKIKIKKIDPKNLEVSRDEVEQVVKYLRQQAAKLNDIDAPAKRGNWIMISFEGSVDHVVKDKLTSKSFPMVLGETKMVPGFEEELLGMKAKDKKEFDVKFPKDFADKEFASKKVHFAVEVEAVKEIELPKLDKEFLEKFGHKNEKELHKAIHKSLVGEKEMREKRARQDEISAEIIKLTKVEVPDSLIEQEAQRMKAELMRDLTARGGTYEKYLENIGIDEKKALGDLKLQAKNNITLGVGLGEIARAQNLKLEPNEGLGEVFDYITKELTN